MLRIPIAHADGNYFCDAATLAELKQNDQIVFRYCAPDGRIDPAANPNGSLDAIAGICNRERNVVGLMPHPERAVEAALGFRRTAWSFSARWSNPCRVPRPPPDVSLNFATRHSEQRPVSACVCTPAAQRESAPQLAMRH